MLCSCVNDFLDRNPLSQISSSSFWNTQKEANAFLNGCYSGWNNIDNIIFFDCVSDNSFTPFPWNGYKVHATGLATPGSTNAINYMGYGIIFRCNTFLQNIDRVKEMPVNLKNRMKAEARFLRAWDFFKKSTLYGGVPLLTEAVDFKDAYKERSTMEEVANFVIKETSEIAPMLSLKYTGNDVGRITRGAALSLKAKMEIFVGKYKEVIKTTEAITNLGVYGLFPDYRKLFYEENENNEEVILDIQYESNNYINKRLGILVPNSSGGWASVNPTQSLVDAFECIDGKTIEESPLYNPKDPYKNRDPRLAATVVCPGDMYEGKYMNSIDAKDPNNDFYLPYGRSKTAYYGRKYVDDLSKYNNYWSTGMNGIVIRYADVLLMYAEAKIETNGIDASVYAAINQVRNRAGMPNVDKSIYNNQTKLRELIRRERRAEFGMEGLRWFDICRWKIGKETMNGVVKGALLGEVDAETGALTLTDKRISLETRVFDEKKNYLWPIPQKVIDNSNGTITQNPNY